MPTPYTDNVTGLEIVASYPVNTGIGMPTNGEYPLLASALGYSYGKLLMYAGAFFDNPFFSFDPATETFEGPINVSNLPDFSENFGNLNSLVFSEADGLIVGFNEFSQWGWFDPSTIVSGGSETELLAWGDTVEADQYGALVLGNGNVLINHAASNTVREYVLPTASGQSLTVVNTYNLLGRTPLNGTNSYAGIAKLNATRILASYTKAATKGTFVVWDNTATLVKTLTCAGWPQDRVPWGLCVTPDGYVWSMSFDSTSVLYKMQFVARKRSLVIAFGGN